MASAELLERIDQTSHQANDGGRMYESKFLINERDAIEVEEWASSTLTLTPQTRLFVSTLYCDSSSLGIYHRSKGFRKHKFRLRRIGDDETVLLERKTRRKDKVKKQQTNVPLEELDRLGNGTPPVDWPGYWFHRQLRAKQLAPVLRVNYERTIFVGETREGALVLTLDRNVQSVPTSTWTLDPIQEGRVALEDRVVLEMEYQGALPSVFKQLLMETRLAPRSLSKYRQCWQSWMTESDREERDA